MDITQRPMSLRLWRLNFTILSNYTMIKYLMCHYSPQVYWTSLCSGIYNKN